MERVAQYAFLLNAMFLILHEMDAIHWKEWRIFGVTNDVVGRVGFILVHIPIFLLILLGLVHFGTTFGRVVSTIISAFLVVHFFLHRRAFSQNLFNEPASVGIIASMLVVSIVQLTATLYLFF